MIAKIVSIGVAGFLITGIIYLGTIGITVPQYTTKIDIPLQKFQK